MDNVIDVTTLRALLAALSEVRKVSRTATVAQVLAFLDIAVNQPEVTSREVRERIDVQDGAMSVILKTIMKPSATTKDAWDMVSYRENVLDRREKHLRLTANGARFAAALARPFNRSRRAAE